MSSCRISSTCSTCYISWIGAVHKLRHAEGGGEGGVSATVTMYALSIHQYGIMSDGGGGGGVKFRHFCVTSFVDDPIQQYILVQNIQQYILIQDIQDDTLLGFISYK